MHHSLSNDEIPSLTFLNMFQVLVPHIGMNLSWNMSGLAHCSAWMNQLELKQFYLVELDFVCVAIIFENLGWLRMSINKFKWESSLLKTKNTSEHGSSAVRWTIKMLAWLSALLFHIYNVFIRIITLPIFLIFGQIIWFKLFPLLTFWNLFFCLNPI